MFHWLDTAAPELLSKLSPQGREVARNWADKLSHRREQMNSSSLASKAVEKAMEWESFTKTALDCP